MQISEKDIQKTLDQIKKRNSMIKFYKEEAPIMKAKITELENIISHKDSEIKNLSSQISRKNQSIAQLQAAVNSQVTEIDKLKSQLQQFNNIFSNLSSISTEEIHQHNQSLKNQLTIKENEIANLKSLNQQKDNIINTLTNTISSIEFNQNQISHISNHDDFQDISSIDLGGMNSQEQNN